MKLIKPVTLTTAMLTSSTVAETDFAEWSAGTTYALGDKRIMASTHRIYQSLQAANTGHTPSDAGSLWWVDIGPTNRWAMFDQVVSTQTTGGTTLTVVMTPGNINSLALINVAASTLTVTLTNDAVTVYSKTVDMTSEMTGADWYAYFFDPIRQKTDVVLLDIPAYATGVLTVTMTAPANVKVGQLIVGRVAGLGKAQYGAKVGITDYSRKETDTFGNTVLTQRSYSKRMNLSLILDNALVDGIHQTLSEVRSTPVVWIASESYTSLIVFGFYKDFEVDISTYYFSYCSLQIEGLI